MKISVFKSAKDSAKSIATIEIENYFSNIKNGLWQDLVLKYRTGELNKNSIPAISSSGTFNERNKDSLLEHSGFICIDIDAKDQVVKFDIEQIKKDPYVYVCHQSLGGFGYALFFKIDPIKHKEAFLGLEKYLLDNYKLIVDPAPQNVASLRFVSYDPNLYENEKAKTFKTYVKKEKKKDTYTYYPTTSNDFDDIVREVTNRGLNLCDDYDTWVKFAFALSTEFGENGRSYFHAFSCPSSKYDYNATDKMFDIALKRNGNGVKIATIYFHCKNAGIKIVSEKTKQIAQVTKLSATKEEAKITLAEMGIEDNGLIDKLKKDDDKERSNLDDVVDLIKFTKIRFNEITRNYEFGKDQMSDRVLAKFYSKCWKQIDEDISKDKIFTLIENPDNTISYNPIKQFFEKNQHLKPKGIFDELCRCFTIRHDIIVDGKTFVIEDYLNTFLKKWLLSIVGSAHGTYSLMILVLNGKQGIAKTEFFRNLLPLELREYYAESNLDEGKDSEILMTKKWLIVDDEFGGKSKKDATKLKRLSSQQTFSIRRPYGRVSEDLQRLAVLGGTSNEAEVINDPTGNRRIIPVNLVDFNLSKYKAIDKVALFMELYHEWEQDRYGWFLTTEEIEQLNDATIKNQEVMAEEELILEYLQSSDFNEMTNTQIKLFLEGKFNSFRTSSKRIGAALKKCGFDNYVKWVDGKTQRVYKCKFKGEYS